MAFKIKNNKQETKELLETSDTEIGVGYIKHSNGILEQWGSALVPANAMYVRAAFKVPYVRDVCVTCTPGYLHEEDVGISVAFENTYIDIYLTGRVYGITKNRSTYWRAIGYWK